jgi:hypothetical protein
VHAVRITLGLLQRRLIFVRNTLLGFRSGLGLLGLLCLSPLLFLGPVSLFLLGLPFLFFGLFLLGLGLLLLFGLLVFLRLL